MKVNIEILSGDSMAAVQTFGPTIGIPSQACRGEMSPETKARWVTGRSRTHVTMMAGDGFNDAAALAAADVGVAIGSAEQVNLEAADVLVPSEDPRQLAKLIKLSRKTRQIVIQNLFISIGIT